MIDRSLNYGRGIIKNYLNDAKPYNNVLDIGAGKGADLSIAKNVSPDCCLYALECYQPNIVHLKEQKVQVSSIDLEKESFPFENEYFDIIIANQILEHTKELFWIFHEITRILKRGGRLIIGVPNLASLHNRLLLLFGRQPSPMKSASAHIRGFTRSDLLHFVNSCWPRGYNLIKWGGSNFYPFPPIIAKPLAVVFPSMAAGLFLLFEKEESYIDSFIQFPGKENLETNYFTGCGNY